MKRYIFSFFFAFTLALCFAQPQVDTAAFYKATQGLIQSENTITLIGEAHLPCSYHAEKLILKWLAENGCQNILIEGGESEAAIINMFMKTGDTTLLINTRAREPSGTYRGFLKYLYTLNKQKGGSLTFRGFDFERILSVRFLFSSWFTKPVNDTALAQQINALLSLDEADVKKGDSRIQGKEIKEVFGMVKASFSQHESSYKTLLGNNFGLFKRIIFNPVYSDFATRDNNMLKLLLNNEKETGLNNTVIIVGEAHILGKAKLVPMLADGLPQKYSLNAFMLAYDKCNYGSKKYSSHKTVLKHMDSGTAGTVNFKNINNAPIIQTERKVQIVLAELYGL